MLSIEQLTEPFLVFTWTALISTLSSPANLAIIFGLVLSEGLLSADNALVLAVLVRHLPKEQQRKAVYYGMAGAVGFRILAIAISVYLVQIQWIQIIGGLYLLHLAIGHFKPGWNKLSTIGILTISALVIPNIYGQAAVGIFLLYEIYKYIRKSIATGGEAFDEEKVKKYGFWRTVLAVELLDISFSCDSILAAVGISSNPWIRVIGEVAGIAMMRFAATGFLRMIDWRPILEHTAYVLISITGLKMISEGAGIYEMNNVVFISVMVLLFVGSIVYNPTKR